MTNQYPLRDRCRIATECLPESDYRARLEALHAEMLREIDCMRCAVADERQRCADVARACVLQVDQRDYIGQDQNDALIQVAVMIEAGPDAVLAYCEWVKNGF